MDLLQWQQTDKNQFAVFIRDLSINLNNVKHMIEDTSKQIDNVKPCKHKKGKKVVKKKKDIIIEQQTKLRLEKNIKNMIRRSMKKLVKDLPKGSLIYMIHQVVRQDWL